MQIYFHQNNASIAFNYYKVEICILYMKFWGDFAEIFIFLFFMNNCLLKIRTLKSFCIFMTYINVIIYRLLNLFVLNRFSVICSFSFENEAFNSKITYTHRKLSPKLCLFFPSFFRKIIGFYHFLTLIVNNNTNVCIQIQKALSQGFRMGCSPLVRYRGNAKNKNKNRNKKTKNTLFLKSHSAQLVQLCIT